MSSLICKNLHQLRTAIRNSPTHHLFFIQIRPLSSSLTSLDQTPNQQSFTVAYLINSCGFSPEKAITASKKVNFETPEKADSVLALFYKHGFTKTQASNLIRKFPQILTSKPDTTLLPKLEFLKSKGVSTTDVVKIVSQNPPLLRRNLENQIIPSFNYLRNLVGSEAGTVTAIKRHVGLLMVDLKTHMEPNLEILRAAGVPSEKIVVLLTYQPRGLTMSSERFRQIVEEVKGMGFNPLKLNFVLAVHALNSMSKSTWEKKVEVYKKWGFSEDEILVAFGKHPWCMMVSEDKITRVMDFIVNKMGWESSFFLERPLLISLSLEKRIVPRCLVYEALYAKGLIKKTDISLKQMLQSTEKWFIKKVVNWTEKEAPELLKLYKEKLALANQLEDMDMTGEWTG